MSANTVAKHSEDHHQPMNVSSSSCDGMDSRIRQLSIDTSESSSAGAPPSSSSQWPIMSSLSSSFVEALDQGSAQPVTPCPSDASCCTDCGVSSSASYTSAYAGTMQHHPLHPTPLHHHGEVGFTSTIPTEVQMTQGKPQASNHGSNAIPLSPVSGDVAMNTTADATKPTASGSPVRMSGAEKRRNFLVLVQIIMKCLKQDEAKNTAILFHTKKVIRECTLKNKQGDPNYASLVDAATPRLRKVVGEKIWRRSIILLRHYMQQQQKAQQSKVVPV